MGEGRGNYETDLEDILFQLWHSQTHMNILLFLTQLDIQHGYQHTGMYQSRLNLMLGCLEMTELVINMVKQSIECLCMKKTLSSNYNI